MSDGWPLSCSGWPGWCSLELFTTAIAAFSCSDIDDSGGEWTSMSSALVELVPISKVFLLVLSRKFLIGESRDFSAPSAGVTTAFFSLDKLDTVPAGEIFVPGVPPAFVPTSDDFCLAASRKLFIDAPGGFAPHSGSRRDT